MTHQLANTQRQTVSSPQLILWHCLRILKRWKANPSIIMMAFIYPLASFVLMKILFSGLIHLFTGRPLDLAQFSLVIGIMSMLTGAVTGAGNIVQERRLGIMDRFASLPSPRYVHEAGRVLAETLRAYCSALVTVVVAILLGADFTSLASLTRTLVVFAFIAVSVGCVAVMLGYASETPQGAVAFAPVIMILGFFNSAIMPLHMYAPALRGLARYSPITLASRLVSQPDIQGLLGVLVYFLSLVLLSVIVIRSKVKKMRA